MSRRNESGITLIEVLVVLGIIGLLMALLLPAVQAVRESARRVQCINNLKQVGIALNHYASGSGYLPPGNQGGFSPLVAILPYLEQRAVYDALNFSISPGLTPGIAENDTVAHLSLSAFLCPSDVVSDDTRRGTNYAGNTGYGFDKGESSHRDNGVFPTRSGTAVRFVNISDGASNTVAFAEWVIGPKSLGSVDPIGTIFVTPKFDEFDPFAAYCRNLDVRTAPTFQSGRKGKRWLIGSLVDTLYNHDQPLNGHTCSNAGYVQVSSWTAGSRHAGGACAVYADGHVGFHKETITPSVWRALGTRGGGEIVSASE